MLLLVDVAANIPHCVIHLRVMLFASGSSVTVIVKVWACGMWSSRASTYQREKRLNTMAGRNAVRNTIGESHRERGRALFCGCFGTTAAMCWPCASKRITITQHPTLSSSVNVWYNYCIIFRTTRFQAGPPDSQGWWSGGPLPQNVNFEPCLFYIVFVWRNLIKCSSSSMADFRHCFTYSTMVL